ncbi:hypothetical protein COLO4_21834 [Corchorus olitorius]|uniref:Uncharacterized protein n=1 Tax=Corchorus olitorius TaxID=93759 RepID=A0A1R3IQE8_9ROSI|nr:hypothetical protein COLO4_21834 [Corchorus olitorius]
MFCFFLLLYCISISSLFSASPVGSVAISTQVPLLFAFLLLDLHGPFLCFKYEFKFEQEVCVYFRDFDMREESIGGFREKRGHERSELEPKLEILVVEHIAGYGICKIHWGVADLHLMFAFPI